MSGRPRLIDPGAVVRLYEQGLSCAQIARLIGVHPSSVSRAAATLGFGLPSRQPPRDVERPERGDVSVGSVELPTTAGVSAVIDVEDYEWLSQWKWCASGGRHTYIQRAANDADGSKVYLHKFIMGAGTGVQVDHINRDPLDCRRANLRFATARDNACNRPPWSASGYKGVHAAKSLWRAVIRRNGVTRRLGLFKTKEEAARAYDRAARRLHGEFAYLNFPADLPSSVHEDNG